LPGAKLEHNVQAVSKINPSSYTRSLPAE